MPVIEENIAKVTVEIASIEDERAAEAERHTKADRALLARLEELRAHRMHLAAGTTEHELELAREMIQVIGDVQWLSHEIITDAAEDIAAGCLSLRREYFGRKFYSDFDQREDHRYGSGPKHGRIVFGIGLTKKARTMVEKWGGIMGDSDGDVSQAMIRYLLNLEEAGVA